MLVELQNYLQAQEKVSLVQISADLVIDMGVVEGLLDFWIARGRVKIVTDSGGCNDCDSGQCGNKMTTKYAWI